MRFFRLFFVYLLLESLSFSISFAADFKALKSLFEGSWTSNYVENRCGENIERFVSLAMDKGIDLDGVEIIRLVDHSGWMFGMVNALEARESGRFIEPKPSQAPFNLPGESNWYFHAFLLVEGKIFDYDFTNAPKVISFKDYLHEMYLPRDKWKDLKYKESKMRRYEIEAFPAEEYILRLRSRLGRSEIARKQFLKDYLPEFFR